jgi:hypothetical protein
VALVSPLRAPRIQGAPLLQLERGRMLGALTKEDFFYGAPGPVALAAGIPFGVFPFNCVGFSYCELVVQLGAGAAASFSLVTQLQAGAGAGTSLPPQAVTALPAAATTVIRFGYDPFVTTPVVLGLSQFLITGSGPGASSLVDMFAMFTS